MIDNLDRILEHTTHLFPQPVEFDAQLREHVWDKLDAALAHNRLQVHEHHDSFGSLRTVTALGLVRITIRDTHCELWASLLDDDGEARRLGYGVRAFDLFDQPSCGHFWLRYAFFRWAPRCSGYPFEAYPLFRPCAKELATSRALLGRLHADPRFRTLPAEFDSAIHQSPILAWLAHEDPDERRCSVEALSQRWLACEQAVLAMQSAIHPRSRANPDC